METGALIVSKIMFVCGVGLFKWQSSLYTIHREITLINVRQILAILECFSSAY